MVLSPWCILSDWFIELKPVIYKVPWQENQRAYEQSTLLGIQFQMNVEVKSDADRMLAEKNKEMEQIKTNSQRVIDSMQSTLNKRCKNDAGSRRR